MARQGDKAGDQQRPTSVLMNRHPSFVKDDYLQINRYKRNEH
jgi:hypothetical protein